MNQYDLRKKITQVLKLQGFKINPHARPKNGNKDTYKALQVRAKKEQIKLHRSFLQSAKKKIEDFVIDGDKLNPNNIDLELRVVNHDSIEEIVFKWWNLTWWSIPYQRAYGRQ